MQRHTFKNTSSSCRRHMHIQFLHSTTKKHRNHIYKSMPHQLFFEQQKTNITVIRKH